MQKLRFIVPVIIGSLSFSGFGMPVAGQTISQTAKQEPSPAEAMEYDVAILKKALLNES
jgi:hypothetical protein